MVTKSIPAERPDKKSQAMPTGWEEVAQALLRNAGLGIYIVQEGKFQYVNPLFQKLTGYTENELLGKYSLDLVHSEDREVVRERAIENLKSKKGSIPYEYRLVKKNGEIIWVLEEVTSINYGGKRATVGSFMDITARKELEEAIGYSEKRYRTILESMEDAYFEIDLTGNFTFVNNAVCRDLGYSREELIGMNYKGYTAEEDIKSLFQAFNEVYRTGVPNRGVPWKSTLKDGSHGFGETSISPLRNSKSEIVGFCGITRDITERKQAEEKLKQSEERYRALFDSSVIGTFVVDVETMKIVMANQAAVKIFGFSSAKEGAELNLLDFTSPEEREKVFELIRKQLFEQDSRQAFDLPAVTKDGRQIWINATGARIMHNDKLAGLLSFRDITARKQAEEALQKSQERYRTLAENAGEAIFVVQDGMIKFMNPKGAELSGYSIEELTSSPFVKFIHPDDVNLVINRYAGRLKGESVPQIYDFRILKKDGAITWSELNAVPISWEDRPAVLCFMNDITERKKVGEALRKSEEKYRTVLDEIGDAYFEVDLKGTLTFVNDQMTQHLQYSKEELLGMNYRTFTAEEEIKNVYEAYNRVYRTSEASLSFGHKVIRKDGTRGVSDVSISPLKNEKGEIFGFRGISRDITVRKQLEEEREALLQEIRKINQKLEEANKELQDFVYIASHDLREPLRKISSFGTLLQDSLKGRLNEDQQENFEFMIDGSRRMQDMIDALLTYSRLTTKAKPFEWVDLNKVIEDLKKLELATMLDETRGIIHVPKPLPSIQADPSQMHQLFQNLIGNGLKFHKEEIPPEIIIRAHEVENNMIRIEVEDNGIGIDEKYHGQLFTMFKRLHPREQYEGTGIGLASCKKIVERHGGNIGIKSTPDKGSTFWLTLPRERYLKED
jgi:PAS domain S-box-containing protein